MKNFNPERMHKVRETYDKWWNNKLGRPIIALKKSIDGKSGPKLKVLNQSNCNDFSISPKELIDRIDVELDNYEYIGDAFPMLNLECFGPGVLAAFCGAKLDNSSGNVWFEPEVIEPDIQNLHIQYDSNNKWIRRIMEICYEGVKRWNGSVLVGFPDLGGVLDVLAVFRTSEALMYDLYDYPEEVHRLINEIQVAWHKAYNDIEEVLMPGNCGYTDWNSLYSREKSYILQCDFGYMISNDMFTEFALPEIKTTANKLGNATYHLDGIGNLKSLNSILGIPEIKMVQWVAGAGQPDGFHWHEVYNDIVSHGKKAQVFGSFSDFEKVLNTVGNYEMFYYRTSNPDVTREQVENLIKSF